jgi:hypothetical protein
LGRALRASLDYALQLQMDNGALHPNPEHLDKPCGNVFDIIVGIIIALKHQEDPALRACLNGLVAYRISHPRAAIPSTS